MLALLLVRKRDEGPAPSLLVAPASLLANWAQEAARFAPGLRVLVRNSAANSMQVFGAGTDTINAVATATGVAQAATTSALSLTPFSTLAMTGGRFSSNVSTSHDGVIHLACGTTASFSGTAIGQGADANDGAGVYDASGDLFASATLDLTCANGECAGGASNACDGGGVMHAGN